MIKLITEGIQHLEDLDLQTFIKVVGNLAKLQAAEKLDGANLWFGIDDDGRLFTSRAGKRKNAENMYEEKEYPYFAAYNGFRAAHAALKAKESEIKKVLNPGSTVEIEVLYGRQPNAVTYGAGGRNYIAFLRGVEGTPDAIVDQLANSFNNTTVTVSVQTVDTIDGVNLKLTPTDVLFQFVGVQKLDTTHLKTTDVAKQLAKLQDYLRQRAPLEGKTITNFDLATASLGAIDKEIRPAAKVLKSQILAKILTDFKLPIKKELLDKFVSKIKSPLAADDLSADEDNGVEGVVLRDPDNGEQVKLVDKDTFTTMNQFNHAVRGSISGTIKTLDPQASLEARGGMLGQLKITIADLLGNQDLARTQTAKKIFQTVKGTTAEETVKNVAKELTNNDDYRGIKTKIAALIDNTKAELEQSLKDFKANKDEFQLKLKSGKTMGLSAEVIRRTLVAYAEAKRDVTELGEKVAKTKSLVQLVALLYGKIAKAVHEIEPAEPTEPVAESKGDRIWNITLSPTASSNPDEANVQEHRIMTALASKTIGGKKGVKLKRIRDDAEGGGYEFEIKTDQSVHEDALWDALADMEVDWGGDIEFVKTLSEHMLAEKRIVTDVSQYHGRDAWTILNTYLAVYMMASIIYQADDTTGIKLLRDQTHMRLTSWNKEMSPLNFWGYVVWRSGTPAVKKLVGPKVAKQIFQQVRHVPASYWRFLHMDLSYGKVRKVEWAEHRKAFAVLLRTPGMNNDRVNTLLNGTFGYSELSFDEKVKFHTKLFYYIQQFAANSPLAYRLRVIYDNLLLNANGENDQMVQEMKLLQRVTAITEDGEAAGAMAAAAGGPGGASPIGPAAATTAGSVASYQQPIFGKNNRKTVMMKRNPDISRYKFPRPKDGAKK
jgi:hypothetical protein